MGKWKLPMTRAALKRALDEDRVRAAIEAAEARSSGEIRVAAATFFWGSVRREAERAFDRLGMRATKERNGVLLFLVPSRRRFVILGDEGLHRHVGQALWDALAESLSARFAAGDFTGGVVEAVERVGDELARHFPRADDDRNELSDALDYGPEPDAD